MNALSPDELLKVAADFRQVEQHLRAQRAANMGPIRIKLRSLFRTHDRLGSGAWTPGQPLRLLILRDFVNRNQLTVKTYQAFSEAHGLVVIDQSPGLLGQVEVGVFARKLGFGLAAAVAWQRQPVVVAGLGSETLAPVKRPDQLARLAAEVVELEPRPRDPETLPGHLNVSLGRPRANLNAFLLTHAGHEASRFEDILRVLAARCRMAVVFLILSIDEFTEVDEAADPNTGQAVVMAPGAAVRLQQHLHNLEEIGRLAGVHVVSLIVREQAADIQCLIPQLAELSRP